MRLFSSRKGVGLSEIKSSSSENRISMSTRFTPPEYSETDPPIQSVGQLRYEIKLVTLSPGFVDVETSLRLHPAAFQTTHPERQVKNIYFDTPDLESAQDNLAGISEREKLRLRWYGKLENIVKGTWELKQKRAGVGRKVSQPAVQNLDISRTTWTKLVPSLRASTSGIINIRLGSAYRPTIINCYKRKYYQSWDGTVRATLDYSQVSFDQKLSSTVNLSRPIPLAKTIVLECV